MALNNWQIFAFGFVIGVAFWAVILAVFLCHKNISEIDEVLGRD